MDNLGIKKKVYNTRKQYVNRQKKRQKEKEREREGREERVDASKYYRRNENF